MSYIVVFPGTDGEEQVVLCPTLDAATSLAEDLRNRRSVADVRLGRVEPIPFTFAPQFRVSLDTQAPQPASRQAPARPEPVAAATAAMPSRQLDTAPSEPTPVTPGELTEAEIAELVALDETAPVLSAEDPMVQDALARRGDRSQRQQGLFGR